MTCSLSLKEMWPKAGIKRNLWCPNLFTETTINLLGWEGRGEGQAISLKPDCFSTERIIQNMIGYRKAFAFLYMFFSEKGKRLARMNNVISQRYWPSLAGSQRGLDGNLSQTALMGNLYLYLYLHFNLYHNLYYNMYFYHYLHYDLYVYSYYYLYSYLYLKPVSNCSNGTYHVLICNQNFLIKVAVVAVQDFKMLNCVLFRVLLIKQSLQWGNVYSPHGDIHMNILNFLQSPYRNNPESHEISHWIYIT